MKELYQDEIESDEYFELQVHACRMDHIKDDAFEKTARSICAIRGIDPDEWIVVKDNEDTTILYASQVNRWEDIDREGDRYMIVKKWQCLYTEAHAVIAAVKAQQTYFENWHVE